MLNTKFLLCYLAIVVMSFWDACGEALPDLVNAAVKLIDYYIDPNSNTENYVVDTPIGNAPDPEKDTKTAEKNQGEVVIFFKPPVGAETEINRQSFEIPELTSGDSYVPRFAFSREVNDQNYYRVYIYSDAKNSIEERSENNNLADYVLDFPGELGMTNRGGNASPPRGIKIVKVSERIIRGEKNSRNIMGN